MDRREFLKITTMAGLGSMLPCGVQSLAAAALPDMVIAQGPIPQAIVEAAVAAMGGMKRFISKGDIVVVKPNIGWDRAPEFAATTNPFVVVTLVKLCLEAGAKKVKVFDHPVNDARRCYVQSKIADAALKAGAEVSYADDWKFKEVTINGTSLKTWPLYTDVLEADKVINVPIAKTHGLTKLTLSLKNWMGIMGGRRSRIHHRIDENLVDVARVIKPTLTVLDAVRILTDNGPQGGDLRDVKKLDIVVVSTDQVAVDAFGATLFGLQGSDLGCVTLADAAGLGKMDYTRLNVKRIKV